MVLTAILAVAVAGIGGAAGTRGAVARSYNAADREAGTAYARPIYRVNSAANRLATTAITALTANAPGTNSILVARARKLNFVVIERVATNAALAPFVPFGASAASGLRSARATRRRIARVRTAGCREQQYSDTCCINGANH